VINDSDNIGAAGSENFIFKTFARARVRRRISEDGLPALEK
jgi:hypothetical protein